MASVVFDIETLALPLASFDDAQRKYLLKFAATDEEREAEIQKFALSPLTAQVVAVAMVNPETMMGKVFFQAAGQEKFLSEDGNVEYVSGTEPELLALFWSTIQHYSQFITFNGRSFDCPFLMLRSAFLGVRPTRNLVPYRYDSNVHCDLLDQLTFYGAARKFNLDLFCKAFGIKSPKSEGITGLDVGPMFAEGKFREIAKYCLGDVIATAELYRRWNAFLNLR